MQKPDKLADCVWRVSAKIGSKDLFEGIWPIPNGVMLNSYVIKGAEKTVLIDLMKDWDGAGDAVEEQMNALGLEAADIDVLVINHMEPDHSGMLSTFFEKNPEIQIYTTAKSVPLIKAFYGVETNIHPVADGETLDIGGRTLVFVHTPNVHWPETMMTYDKEDGILFSCDAFGAYGQYEHCFRDELSPAEEKMYRAECERYYVNIVAAFSLFVLKAIQKLSDLGVDVKIVAPSHGVVWRKHPEEAIAWTKKLASYASGRREKEITLVWASMYGNTAQIVPEIEKACREEGVVLHEIRIPENHVSYVLPLAWRSSAIIFGMPTYTYKMFPPMYDVMDEMERSRFTGRETMRFGSFGWSGGAQKQFDEFAAAMKFNHIGNVEFQGRPTEEDKKKAYEMAKKIAQDVKNG